MVEGCQRRHGVHRQHDTVAAQRGAARGVEDADVGDRAAHDGVGDAGGPELFLKSFNGDIVLRQAGASK